MPHWRLILFIIDLMIQASTLHWSYDSSTTISTLLYLQHQAIVIGHWNHDSRITNLMFQKCHLGHDKVVILISHCTYILLKFLNLWTTCSEQKYKLRYQMILYYLWKYVFETLQILNDYMCHNGSATSNRIFNDFIYLLWKNVLVICVDMVLKALIITSLRHWIQVCIEFTVISVYATLHDT